MSESTVAYRRCMATWPVLVALCFPGGVWANDRGGLMNPGDETASPLLGSDATAESIARQSITVYPDGTGLPNGSGSVADGAHLYQQHCRACHGERGRGGPNDALAGGTLNATPPVRTIGSYWPHATTVFDYVRRAMPYTAPGSLTDNEAYALTAYLLHINDVLDADAVLNAAGIHAIQMPNADGFTHAYTAPHHEVDGARADSAHNSEHP